jgi:transposase-like protein
MKKAIVFLLLTALVSFTLASCEKEVVTYCPSCSKTTLKEISAFNSTSHLVETRYKCTSCGFEFSASKL